MTSSPVASPFSPSSSSSLGDSVFFSPSSPIPHVTSLRRSRRHRRHLQAAASSSARASSRWNSNFQKTSAKRRYRLELQTDDGTQATATQTPHDDDDGHRHLQSPSSPSSSLTEDEQDLSRSSWKSPLVGAQPLDESFSETSPVLPSRKRSLSSPADTQQDAPLPRFSPILETPARLHSLKQKKNRTASPAPSFRLPMPSSAAPAPSSPGILARLVASPTDQSIADALASSTAELHASLAYYAANQDRLHALVSALADLLHTQPTPALIELVTRCVHISQPLHEAAAQSSHFVRFFADDVANPTHLPLLAVLTATHSTTSTSAHCMVLPEVAKAAQELASSIPASPAVPSAALLEVLVNLTTRNSSVRAQLGDMPRNKRLIRRLIALLSSDDVSVVLHSLRLLTAIAINAPLEARIFAPANSQRVLGLIFNIISKTTDMALVSGALALLVDMLHSAHILRQLEDFDDLNPHLLVVWNMLSSHRQRTVIPLLQFLTMLCDSPALHDALLRVALTRDNLFRLTHLLFHADPLVVLHAADTLHRFDVFNADRDVDVSALAVTLSALLLSTSHVATRTGPDWQRAAFAVTRLLTTLADNSRFAQSLSESVPQAQLLKLARAQHDHPTFAVSLVLLAVALAESVGDVPGVLAKVADQAWFAQAVAHALHSTDPQDIRLALRVSAVMQAFGPRAPRRDDPWLVSALSKFNATTAQVQAEMRAQCERLEDVNARQQQRLDEAVEELGSREASRMTMAARAESSSQELRKAYEAALDRKDQALEDIRSAFENQLAALRREHEADKNQLASANSELASLRESHSHIQQSVARLKAQVAEATDRLEDQRKENRKLLGERSKSARSLDKAQRVMVQQDARARELEEMLSTAVRQNDVLVHERTQLEARVRDLDVALQREKQLGEDSAVRLGRAHVERDEAMSELRQADARAHGLQEELHERDARIEKLEAQLQHAKHEQQSLRDALESKDEELLQRDVVEADLAQQLQRYSQVSRLIHKLSGEAVGDETSKS